jgi:hypothetical protein
MRTETRTIFKFDELPSEAAKEKARAWYRHASEGDDFWQEYVIEDAIQCAEIIGIEIGKCRHSARPAVYFSGFWSQGDGASFEGRYTYKKGAAKAIRQHAPQDAELHRIADKLQTLQKRIFYRGVFDVTQSGRYCHETTMRVEWTEYCPEDLADDILEALRDFARWIYRRLEAEYEYCNSDEAIEENMMANEYEFDADGEII